MERQEKVTRKELRAMHIGQTRIINLAHPNKVASARVTCRQMRLEYGLEFEAKPDYVNWAICITRKK